ncbi:MAG: M48 family metalloprotease [Desulfatiglans sp.]|nr:M48 family metalloprotease [Thermodesulfobacteriota bacterium]MEE4353489.1 M48 family metalloprotease [Desulfatiglans sp.]
MRSLFFLFFLVLNLFLFTADTFALSIEEERNLGDKFLSQIKEHFDFIDDEFVSDYMNDLGRYLSMSIDTRPFPFRFYVIDDNTLNAFAAPGGHIFVFSGLADVLDNVDELASVICHEMGHITARHLSKRIAQSKKIGLATMAGILAGALIGGELSEAMMTGSVAAGLQAQLHYSREDERQADQLGFKYMDSSGFDPRGMERVLKKMAKGRWFGDGEVPAYLTTHPTGPERMSNLDSMMSGYTRKDLKKEAIHFREDFSFFQTTLRARCLEPREAETLFRRALERDASSPLPHFGLGIVFRQQSRLEEAIGHLTTALKKAPTSLHIMRTLGETYQMNGQDGEAVKVLDKALTIDGQDSTTMLLLARAYENLEDYDKAVRILEKLAVRRIVKKEVYYHLGISHGRQNNLALAHYYFGIFFKEERAGEKARFHLRKAAELSGNDETLKKKIRQVAKGLPE